jgi:hypothetical protein
MRFGPHKHLLVATYISQSELKGGSIACIILTPLNTHHCTEEKDVLSCQIPLIIGGCGGRYCHKQ